ncbi:MAG: amino acid adenylation domain-containing protein, partial [Luteimonas sp.]
MAAHFGTLLTALVKAPHESVFKAAMLDQAERQQLLVEWNSTQSAYPQDKCLHELFEEQAARSPDAPAVLADDAHLSYGELNARANRLAHYLRGLGVQPDDRIAICAQRGAGMVVAMLATLKAGAGYVPLDPAYPADRLAYMLKDSAPKAVLTQGQAGAALPAADVARIDLDADAPRWAGLPTHDLDRAAVALLPGHLAYIIYTSGSTGMPKGVMIEHGNAVNFVCWARAAFAPELLEKTLFATSLNFDLALYECFVPLSAGGSTTIVANALALLSQEADVSLINTVPSAIEALVDAGAIPATVKLVNLAGEALKRALVERLFAASAVDTVCNLYGPSETTTYSTWVAMPRAGGFVKHIGRPIANTTVYLLDAHGQLVPPGVPGEIYIGGAGVARGYLNRPDLSAERFLADRFAQAPEARMYRTGDLARYLPDGNIEYLGRIDHQVKIRGFRIELGEIEHALATHAQVANAVVLAKESAGGQRLVAYAVVENVALHGQPLVEALRRHLAQTLPEYMIPQALVLLAALPLTPNGKLDRKALPEPDLAHGAASYVAPSTELELVLCATWQEVLGVAQVGLTDNFFQLGGHSLLATRLVAQINQRLGLVLPLKALFQSPTPAGLAQVLSQLERGLDRPALLPVTRGQDLLLSYSQQRLWVLDQIDGGSAHYNLPGALRLSGTLDEQALNRALHSILARHESLRTCFEVGADGQPRQVVKDAPAFAAPVTDLSHLPAGEQQLQVAARVADEAGQVFDLRCDLMLRAALLKLAGDEHILLVTMHHIASDGWSIGIFIQEFSALYSAYAQGRANPLAPLAIQYADYAQWQRNWLQGDVLDRQLDYWTTQLADLPVAHSLPLD